MNTDDTLKEQGSKQEPQKKPLSELPDEELEQMCNEINTVIDGLSALDPATLAPEKQQEHQEMLSQAFERGSALELERISRLVGQLRDGLTRLLNVTSATEEVKHEPV
jgi:hypothetical protein